MLTSFGARTKEAFDKDTLEPETWPDSRGFSETRKHNVKMDDHIKGAELGLPEIPPGFFPLSLGFWSLVSSVFLFLCSLLNCILKKHFLKGKGWEKNTEALKGSCLAAKALF